MKHFGSAWISLLLFTLVKCFPNDFLSHFEIPTGKFWTFYEFQIEASLQLPSYQVSSLSHCRAICFTKNCSTLSMNSNISDEDSESKMECRITDLPIHNLTLYPSHTSISEAKERSFDFFHGVDGVFYSQPFQGSTTKSDLEETCKKMNKNGRIPILKTMKQYESYWSFRDAVNLTEEESFSFLDLTYDFGESDFRWPDGTYYKTTELYPLVEFVSQEIRSTDIAVTGTVLKGGRRVLEERTQNEFGLIICQVDPFVDFEKRGSEIIKNEVQDLYTEEALEKADSYQNSESDPSVPVNTEGPVGFLG